jgi:hypothetical protein
MMTTAEDLYHDDPYIELQSGVWHLRNPYYLVSDMAHNLAQINRYTGAGNFPYSVAEHSVLVSRLMETVTGGDPVEGLFHDASEAYLNDLSSPVKGELPDYKRLEAFVEGGIRKELNLVPTKSDECKRADQLALFIESYDLMPSRGTKYPDKYNLRPQALLLRDAGFRIVGHSYVHAEREFWNRKQQLTMRACVRASVTERLASC